MGLSSREFALLFVGVVAGIFATCSFEALRQNSPVARTIHRKIQEASGLLNRQGHDTLHTRQREGFYIKPGTEYFVAVAESDPVAKTDKFTAHNYQTIYAKHFELGPGHHRVHKMLEIGLGCNMHTGAGIGSSARLWRKYFPTAEIWFAEYDAACLVAKKEEIDRINIKTVAGDQADPVTLARWQQESGGNFDVIIDDGGHGNNQQWQSLLYLFQNSLKPGGMYVIEDMALGAFDTGCDIDPMCAHMDQVMAQWIQQLTFRDCTRVWKERPALKGDRHYPMLPRLKSIECTAEACTLVKCFDDDTQCDYPSCTDPEAYKSPPAMAAPVAVV